MSLYIGKDANNKPLFHITSGTSSKTVMQSPTPVGNSVFHSNLNYVSFDKYDCTFTAGVSTLYEGPYPIGYAIPETPMGVYIALPSQCLEDIVINNRIWIIEINRSGVKTLVLNHMTNLYSSNAIFFNSAHTSWSKTLLSYTHPQPFIKATGVTGIRVYVLNINTTQYLPPSQDSSGIYISGDSITINSVDLLNFPYMSTAVMNNVDSNPSLISGSVQFINSDLTGSSLELSSENSNYKIKKNGHDIFNSSLGSKKVFFKTIETCNVPSATFSFNTTYDYLLSSSMSAGDIFLVTITVDNSSTVNGPSFIMSQTDGDEIWTFQFSHPSLGGGDKLLCMNGGLYFRRLVTYPGSGTIAGNALTVRVTILQ